MNKRIALFLVPVLTLAIFIGCQKEKSFETSGTPSVGTLQSDVNGDCMPKNVVGTYEAGTPLVAASNYIEVTVDVTTTGSFTIATDTVNGFYFRATGVFTSTGMNQVILRGTGTPGISGINSFEVRYGLQTCIVQVTVLPAGSGGPAAGTLGGGPGPCAPFTLNGAYAIAVALTGSHNVQVQLNITTAGSYSITTDTVAGFWFSGSGTVLTGTQTITLNGNGIPVSGGPKTFTVKFGSSTCTFTVNVSSPASGTLGGSPGACAPITVNGTYTQGIPLTSSNTVQVEVNVTTAGAYSITSNMVSGFSFSASGNFATTGTQTVTLNGNGTPAASGNLNFTVTFGSSTCTFSVNVSSSGAAGTLGGAPGTCAPITVNGTYTQGAALTASNTVQVQVNVTATGAYSITTNTASGFSFSGNGNFATTGTQTVTLNGTGTPSASGTINFTVTFGSSTCTFTVTVAAAVIDYFPRTTGSNWSYEFDDDANDSLLVYVIAPTLSALGNTYNIFMQNDGSGPDSSGYFRKAGGNYYRYVNLQDYFTYDAPQWVEFIFMKDDQNTGHTWTTAAYTGTIGGSPIILRIKFTILQKDVTVPVTTSTGTVNHINTIVVEEKYEAFDGASWQPLDTIVGYFKDYYSRNTGWILDEYISTSGNLSNKMELRRHQVY
jgi:hypothetical protein